MSPSPVTAAWEIQVELSYRVGLRHPRPAGLLLEEVAGCRAVLDAAREQRAALGADADSARVRQSADAIETVLGPTVERWELLLAALEATRPKRVLQVDHESRWEHAAQMRTELDAVVAPLSRINAELAEVSGANLEPPLPTPDGEIPPG